VKRADSWGSHTALHTHCAVSHSTLSSGSRTTWQKVLPGFASTYASPALSDGARFRLCLDNVRELSASTRGSALVFQGVAESHYKMLGRKNPGSSVTVCFHRRGGTIGEGYQSANYGSRVHLAFCVSGLCRRAFSTRTQRQSNINVSLTP